MKRRWLGGLAALLLVLTAVFPAGWSGVRAEAAPEALTQTGVSADARSYDQYRALNADQPAGTQTVAVPLSAGQPDEEAQITLENGWNGAEEAVLWDNAAGTVTWPVTVEQAGWYCLAVTYHTRKGSGGPVALSLMVDGETPFSGCETLTLPRFWRDELEDGEMPRDSSGNEVQPAQSEVLRWETVLLSSADGLYPDAWQFYFSAGEHTLSLTLGGEPVAIGALELRRKARRPIPARRASIPLTGAWWIRWRGRSRRSRPMRCCTRCMTAPTRRLCRQTRTASA